MSQAGLLVNAVRSVLAAVRAPKLRDAYRKRLESLIRSKVQGQPTTNAPKLPTPPVAHISAALKQSLARKPPRLRRRRGTGPSSPA